MESAMDARAAKPGRAEAVGDRRLIAAEQRFVPRRTATASSVSQTLTHSRNHIQESRPALDVVGQVAAESFELVGILSGQGCQSDSGNYQTSRPLSFQQQEYACYR